MAETAPAAEAVTVADKTTVDSNLKAQSMRGGIVRIGGQGVMLLLRMGATAILARMLTPADFGLFAMVTTMTAFIESFRDFGLPMALIHKQMLTREQMDALFRLSLRLNLILTGILVAVAPFLAAFYREPRVLPMTWVAAGALFVIGLSAQHEGLLSRQMRFDLLVIIEVGAMVISLLAAIVTAWAGAGYWALVIQFVVMMVVRAVWTWLVCPWRPRWKADAAAAESMRGMITYSGELTASRILNYLTRNIDTVAVGYFAGSASLGLYDRAYQWTQIPVRQIYGTLLSVAVASLSRVRHDADLYRQYCQTALLPVFALGMPPLVFMFVEAEKVVLLLLGDQWGEAVPLFQLMAIAAYFGSMSMVTRWLYLSEGQTRRLLQWNVISLPVMLLAVLVGAQSGVIGIGVAFTATTCALTYPSIAYCLKTSPLNLRDFFGIVWRPIFASMLAGTAVVVLALLPIVYPHLLIEISIKLLVFVAAYAFAWLLLPGGRAIVIDALSSLKARTGRSV
jgi:PST family polysaccharide transporter